MKVFLSFVFAAALPFAAVAQSNVTSDDLLDALMLPEVLDIMHEEALEAGEELILDFAPERAGAGWTDALERINDPARAEAMMRENFAALLPPEHIGTIHMFLQHPEARQIIGLEVSARQALLDPDVEAASIIALSRYAVTHADRLEQVERFVEANGLVDENVVGALNSNAAFLMGLQAGSGAYVEPGSVDEMVREVLSQEPEIRAGTEEWVYSFLMMAYLPVSDEDMETYIAFSETDPGQALNAALFGAFNKMFVTAARETGEALAQLMSSEEL